MKPAEPPSPPRKKPIFTKKGPSFIVNDILEATILTCWLKVKHYLLFRILQCIFLHPPLWRFSQPRSVLMGTHHLRQMDPGGESYRLFRPVQLILRALPPSVFRNPSHESLEAGGAVLPSQTCSTGLHQEMILFPVLPHPQGKCGVESSSGSQALNIFICSQQFRMVTLAALLPSMDPEDGLVCLPCL